MLLKQKLYLLIPLIIVPALLAGACTKTGPAQTGGLEDTVWTLEQYGEQGNPEAVLEGTEITATFASAEGQVNGSAGCNHYFGSYEVSNNRLSVPKIGYTEMYCMEPEGVMEQERQYLRILQAAENYRIQNNKLLVDCGDGELVFVAGEE